MQTEIIGIGNNLVIGLGEVGKAIQEILGCPGHDPLKGIHESLSFDVLHICFPYSATFERDVENYREEFSAKLVIIHSTVPVGTSTRIRAVHSPVRGIHPHLAQGIRTFVKYFGGPDSAEAAKIFEDRGIKTKTTILAENTEAMKIWDTTQYGWNIILEKRIYEYCQEHGLDFDIIYTDANSSYNGGYEELGHPEYKKYVLEHREGKIGGHCVIPNLEFLDTKLAKFIKDFNATL